MNLARCGPAVRGGSGLERGPIPLAIPHRRHWPFRTGGPTCHASVATGFEAFAWLSRAAAAEPSDEARASFSEHAHALLPLLLMHADHPDDAPRRAALAALRALKPWFALDRGLSVLPDDADAPGAWLQAMGAALPP